MRPIALALTLSLAGLAAGPASSQDALQQQARQLFKPIPATPPALPGNPATAARVTLGKMLYFDPRLSESHAISCNSCHM
ncbi:MAG: cytochrome C peroxidase, partial [Xanthomonadaceae bacterium]|nr:cytochrome C peroxidase [Xanthomonadaceae bacterium]